MTGRVIPRRGLQWSAFPVAALVILVSGCGLSVSLPGRGSSTGSRHHARLVAIATKGQHQAAGVNHPRQKRHSALHYYAVRILPVLHASVGVFDQAVSAVAANADGANLADICNQYAQQIGILSGQFDGVPHPWLWTTPPGRTHHNVAGVYHYMMGALTACDTAVQSSDQTTEASAISDMRIADANMHAQDTYIHWLTTRP